MKNHNIHMQHEKTCGRIILLWLCILSLAVSGFAFPAKARADVSLPKTGMTVSDSYIGGPYYQKLIDAMYESAEKGLSPVERFVKIAESQIGYMGSKVDGQFDGNGSGGEYTEYNRHFGRGAVDWCAYFVSWCSDAAGLSAAVMPKETAYARQYASASVGSFHRMWSEDFTTPRTDYTPQPGDICLYMPTHKGGCGDHYNAWTPAAHAVIVKDVITNNDGSWTFTTIERRTGNIVGSGKVKTNEDRSSSSTCHCGLNSGSECAHIVQGFFHPDWSKASVWTAGDLPSREPLDLGASFDAHIIFKHPWRLAVVNSTNNNVEIGDELRRAVEDWHFERQSDGSYIIESVYNGKVLDVDGANPSNATNVQVYQRWGEDNPAQKWYIYNCSDGYRLSPKLAPGRCFDAAYGEFTTGTNIHIYDSNSSDSQVLSFYRLDYPVLTSVSVPETLTLAPTDEFDLPVTYAPSGVWTSCTGMYFSSSDPEVAAVSGGGRIQALKPGTVTIRATSAYNDLLFDECRVTVQLPFSMNRPTMPKGLKTVGEEAFEGTRLWTIALPEGCTKIENRTFAKSDLRYIYIPDSVKSFGQNLFEDGRLDLTIFCHSGSAAEAYAVSNGIRYYLVK